MEGYKIDLTWLHASTIYKKTIRINCGFDISCHGSSFRGLYKTQAPISHAAEYCKITAGYLTIHISFVIVKSGIESSDFHLSLHTKHFRNIFKVIYTTDVRSYRHCQHTQYTERYVLHTRYVNGAEQLTV
jgi:hypothetical protein